MTTQLSERLRDLAEDAPATLAARGLWDSGRRRHRRRVVTTAVVAACVMGTSLLGLGDWRSRQPSPATPPATNQGPMTVPDRLFDPSPWTPSTRTPGRLVAVFTATRDHFPFGSERNAVAGVAAGSQTYRFLDLPGQASFAPDVELSPDGRHLAYWITRGPGDPVVTTNALVGVGVLDLVTGSVERHVVDAPFGLAPQSLTWVDSHTLAMVSDRFRSAAPTSFAGHTRTYLFTLGESSGYARLSPADVLDVPVASPGRYAEMVGHRRMRVENGDANNTESYIGFSAPTRSVAYDASRGRVAVTEGNVDASGPTSGPLAVGEVRHGHVRLTAVPGGRTYDQVLAWVDPRHVTTVRQTRDGLVYDLVDVRTGARRELTSKPWYAFQVARDALRGARTVPGIAPPSPWNPRWVALSVLGAWALAAGATVLVRRSRVRG